MSGKSKVVHWTNLCALNSDVYGLHLFVTLTQIKGLIINNSHQSHTQHRARSCVELPVKFSNVIFSFKTDLNKYMLTAL